MTTLERIQTEIESSLDTLSDYSPDRISATMRQTIEGVRFAACTSVGYARQILLRLSRNGKNYKLGVVYNPQTQRVVDIHSIV